MPPTNTADVASRRPAEMYFETIKTHAGRIFSAAVDAEAVYRGVHHDGDSPSYRALLPFIRMVAAERDALRSFTLSLPPPHPSDWLAQQARWQAEHGRYHWSQLLLQVREAGLRRIDDWDVRCLCSLIELFPDCVPRSWRHATLYSDIAEPSGEWRVSVLPASPRSSRGTGPSRS
ncbi:hypothetical protein BA022_08540 [Diaphorobacter nitroreducens]|uniref:hypothetical protein n=1 Tax=Diaphorobacter nitroreducens TaxID=164759 RepID=UPI000B598A47|nr:hypothetical protein [Diaphorobacter nitroreducens]ASI68601.1 hypothetical protein BA022_08540 [Diaphorobacter nitroreducens]